MEALIKLESRSALGSRNSRKLRASGSIPAVLYGKGQDMKHLAMNKVDARDYFAKVASKDVKIEIDGKQQEAIIQEVQRHPITRDILHIDFLRK